MAEAFSNGGVSFHYGYVICEFLAQELDCSSGTGIVGVGLPLAMEAQAPIKVESSMALLAIDSTGKTSKKKSILLHSVPAVGLVGAHLLARSFSR